MQKDMTYQFRIKIAGHVAEIESQYIRSQAICRDFLTDEEPELTIRISQEDIEKEREIHKQLYGDCTLWDSSLETIALHALISTRLIDYGAFMMHGAAVAYNNRAYIFSAKSGTGKTTHVMQWLKRLPEAFIINGDKPFIATGTGDNPPSVCGSPWGGKENYYTNTMVPVRSVIMMERAEENSIEQISFADAFPLFLQQVFIPEDEERLRKTLHLMQSLGRTVSFWRFRCNNFREDCFDVAYNALVRDQEKN